MEGYENFAFVLGIIIGIAFGIVIHAIAQSRLIAQKAKHEGCICIGGKFYHVLDEKTYNRLASLRFVHGRK